MLTFSSNYSKINKKTGTIFLIKSVYIIFQKKVKLYYVKIASILYIKIFIILKNLKHSLFWYIFKLSVLL